MTQHYTKTTVQAEEWCKVCGKNTPHNVHGGKLGYCMACYGKPADLPKKKKKEPLYERTLFDER